MIQWRYIEDKQYGGYAVQKLKRFLFWKWWSNEVLCQREEDAKHIVMRMGYKFYL